MFHSIFVETSIITFVQLIPYHGLQFRFLSNSNRYSLPSTINRLFYLFTSHATFPSISHTPSSQPSSSESNLVPSSFSSYYKFASSITHVINSSTSDRDPPFTEPHIMPPIAAFHVSPFSKEPYLVLGSSTEDRPLPAAIDDAELPAVPSNAKPCSTVFQIQNATPTF